MSVVSHELVHVTGRSREPRFLDDPKRDAEENAATEVASAVSAAPRDNRDITPTTEGESAGEEGTSQPIDLDDLLDRLTDRMLIEVERRGGRYGGRF